MTAFTTTPANASADPRLGSIIKSYVTVAEVTLLDAVYKDSNGKVGPADADADTTQARGFGVACGASNMYGETTIPAGGTVQVCEFGPVYGFSGLTPGQYGWVSKEAGEIDDTKPTDAVQRLMGHAQTANCFFVNPGESEDASA